MKKSTKIIIYTVVIVIIILIIIISRLLSERSLNNNTSSTRSTNTSGTNYTTDNDNVQITYESTSKVYNIEGTEHTITVKQDFPTVKAKNADVQNTLQAELGEISNALFDELKKSVEERLVSYTPERMDSMGDLIVSWNLSTVRNDDKVISVRCTGSGSFGVLPWSNKRGYSFDATTGKRLTINGVANHAVACKKYINESTTKYIRLNSDKLGITNTAIKDLDNLVNIEKITWYFSSTGITLCFDKHYVSPEPFEYTISYDNISGYVKKDYLK